MKTHTSGLTQFSDLMAGKDIDALIARLGRQYEAVEKETADPKKRKQFWWEQITKRFYPEEWEDPKERTAAFKRVMGQTSKFTLGEIRYCFESSLRKRIPRAYFWALVKKKREEIKKQLAA